MRFIGIQWLVLVFSLNYVANAGHILAIFAFEGPIQYAFVEPLLKRLVQRGHHVTSITNFPIEDTAENFRNIVIAENEILYNELLRTLTEPINKDRFDMKGSLFSIGFKMCENILGHELVQDIMQNDSFDLLFLDLIFSESLFGLAEHFQAPIVGFSTLGTTQKTDAFNMHFWTRCLNVALSALKWLHYHYKYLVVHKEIYVRYFPNVTRNLDDMRKNFALVLRNDHFVISTPRPYVPNMIEVAGLHIPDEPETLSEDVKQILDSSQQGVIYVAIDDILPDHIMQMVLQQFQGLQQLVLWNSKTKPSTFLGKPSNVQFHTNLSHHAILSHPLVNLIICHGGYHHIIDSIHYGVPVLGIPNARGHPEDYFDLIGKMSHGISLRQSHFNNQTLQKALLDLLFSDHYRREAKLKSLQFRDQQNTPLERAIYWIEYVLRHNGAGHLRNLGQNLSLVEFYNLDIGKNV
uniref:UDP-glucuronosyltransferase n=1 Tax=Stomoxys calcitrans TaxID=35570 RepID=A0A1I8PE68_STOCA